MFLIFEDQEEDKVYSLLPLIQHCTGDLSQGKKAKRKREQQEGRKYIKNGKEEIKLSLFEDNTILYVKKKNPKESVF